MYWADINNIGMNAKMIEAMHKILENFGGLYDFGFAVGSGQALNICVDASHYLGTPPSSAMLGALIDSIVGDEVGEVAAAIVTESYQIADSKKSIAIDKHSDVAVVQLLFLRQL